MEVKIGLITFFSNFDSGNLAGVERVKREANGEVITAAISLQDQNFSGSINDVPSLNLPTPDFEYNLWTTPDCAGTPYENLNRTWFYFGVKGCPPGKLVKFNLMNLNKQGKLYSQGMAPFVKVLPCRNKWERIRERPSYEIVDGHFQLSFVYRFPDYRNIVCYFAFCYPYSYQETQAYLQELDTKFKCCLSQEPNTSKATSIYYHRELLCKSVDGLRVDLLTVTSPKGMLQEKEPRLNRLFPDMDTQRANQFQGKKVFVLTSRVHPGETPSSYVFKGFLDFITRRDDPRAVALRDKFVFKLVPLLNPDGVKRGHYRTDQRGVNLNRVYLEPSQELHPTIYAIKALVAYHHGLTQTLGDPSGDKELDVDRSNVERSESLLGQVGCSQQEKERNNAEMQETGLAMQSCSGEERQMKSEQDENSEPKKNNTTITVQEPTPNIKSEDVVETVQTKTIVDDESKGKGLESSDGSDSACDIARNSGEYISEEDPSGISHQGFNQVPVPECTGRTSEENTSEVPSSTTIMYGDNSEASLPVDRHGHESLPTVLQGELADNKDRENSGSLLPSNHEIIPNKNIVQTNLPIIASEASSTVPTQNPTRETAATGANTGSYGSQWVNSGGLGFYVDLHGHASKRGCFMYGNYIGDEDKYVQCLLFPKLISINSAHFDFSACNFSEKNMYSRDKRDGMSKEGSGRVAIYKMTGLPHCYTLECNYNSGRSTNAVPPATCDDGRATPPPPPGFPPRYTPEIFEEVGRAVAISALDMVNANPWSRLPNSEHGCLEGVKNWVCRYVRSCNKTGGTTQKKTQKVITKASSFVTNSIPTTARPLLQRVNSTNNEPLNSQSVNDTVGSTRSSEKAVVTRQRSSVNNFSNKKSPGTVRNQVNPKSKDQGRKRLNVAKTTPLLMLSNGDTNAHQLRLERNDIRCEKPGPFMNFERHKSNVMKKLRDDLASMRMENCPEVNGNNDIERKTSKLHNMVSVKQLDYTGPTTLPDPKSDIFIESESKGKISEKESDRTLTRPLISRRRRSKRTIRKETNKIACGVVGVKSIPTPDVLAKNSSQVSL